MAIYHHITPWVALGLYLLAWLAMFGLIRFFHRRRNQPPHGFKRS